LTGDLEYFISALYGTRVQNILGNGIVITTIARHKKKLRGKKTRIGTRRDALI